jgi:uncharacterized protein
MSNIQRFQRATLAAHPWKNGGGVTREIVSWPPGSTVANFNWRVSIAHIASSGPFSAFPGVDRVIILLEGGGVMLTAMDGSLSHRLDQVLQPFPFSGEAPIEAHLLGPDCHDFNVMTRRLACKAKIESVKSRTLLPRQSQGLLFSASGDWHANEHTLLANEGLWWHDESFAWTLTPQTDDATLIAVLIEPTQ